MGKKGKKNIPTALFTCLKCGDLKVGTQTIRISRYRLDMGTHPIKSVTTVDYPAAPASDHSVSGLMTTFTAAANLAFGDVCYINSSGQAALVDADAIASSSGLVMCADATISSAASGNFLLHGVARDDTWAWTPGALIYITVTGTTGNTLSATAPTGTDDVIQIVGVATHADRMFFSPQLVQVEHT